MDHIDDAVRGRQLVARRVPGLEVAVDHLPFAAAVLQLDVAEIDVGRVQGFEFRGIARSRREDRLGRVRKLDLGTGLLAADGVHGQVEDLGFAVGQGHGHVMVDAVVDAIIGQLDAAATAVGRVLLDAAGPDTEALLVQHPVATGRDVGTHFGLGLVPAIAEIAGTLVGAVIATVQLRGNAAQGQVQVTETHGEATDLERALHD